MAFNSKGSKKQDAYRKPSVIPDTIKFDDCCLCFSTAPVSVYSLRAQAIYFLSKTGHKNIP